MVVLIVTIVEMFGQFAITWTFFYVIAVFSEPIVQCVPSVADVD